LSRGRFGNTAHVATVDVPADAPDGAVLDAVRREPMAVLGAAFEGAQQQLSALQEATESATEAKKISTPAEMLADASELATAGRTVRWLDDLAAEGKLTDNQRARIAAEDGAPTLARVLRRAELAGHDPRQVLDAAVTARDFAGARELSNVIHDRIKKTVRLEPVGDSYTDWLPKVEDEEMLTYLRSLADKADGRRRELGEQLADDPKQWATEAFGPVPEQSGERENWIDRASVVAAHRELTGYDDAATALGSAPKSGQVQEYASWRAAWRALGRPEDRADEEEMSDGRLLMRIRAWEREAAWGPAFVGNELAGTHQAQQRHQRDATMRRADAEAAAGETDRARLLREATQADALADVLGRRAAELEAVDQARGLWLAHTAETRAAADRARAQLQLRAVERDPVERVTSEEWLTVHNEHMAAEDVHRDVTAAHDLTDVVEQKAADLAAVQQTEQAVSEESEMEVTDLREVAALEPAVVESEKERVPSTDESAGNVERAQRALREVQAREAADAQRAAEEAQANEMYRRNTAEVAEAVQVDEDAAVAS
jgi:hypothetical protein